MNEPLSKNGLIAAEDLYYMIGGKEPIRILDATFGAPGGLSPYQAFLSRHIEGAQPFDIDVVADQDAPLPHTLPDADYFASCVAAMGISNGDHVVVYDQSGMYMASSRAWWMFRAFGHENVYVLDGGLKAWADKGFRTVTGAPEAPPMGNFTAVPNRDLIATSEDLLKNVDEQSMQVIDARDERRFAMGHIPQSENIPFVQTFDHDTRLFKSGDALRPILAPYSGQKVAVSCGSGVTACTVALALFAAHGQNAAIYDGSWAEWSDPDLNSPIEVSA